MRKQTALTLSRPLLKNQEIKLGLILFCLSFIALFLELMFIRWAPSVVRLVAYYANLMLISSFLGLGLGALLSQRNLRLFNGFPLVLLINIAFFWFCSQYLLLSGNEVEYRFFVNSPKLLNYLTLIAIFIANTIVFIPIGERIGQCFGQLPPLKAYSWDLGGSLAGTLCFGLFSFYWFSPWVGLFAVILLYLVINQSHRLINIFLIALTLVMMNLITDPNAIWSPYHYISVHENGSADDKTIASPRQDLTTITDPPIYTVKVNQDFYQLHGTLELNRYQPNSPGYQFAQRLRSQYLLPYQLQKTINTVAVVGSGGGMDVEAALISGAKSIDAVEIDPTLIQIAKDYNSSNVYADPRVTIHINDARAFIHQTNKQYDLIIFGFLDSQSLFSSMSNIRLDGFVYTVESIRTAYNKLSADGMISLSFYIAGNRWLADKLIEMCRLAVGKEPAAYTDGNKIIIGIYRNEPINVPQAIGEYQKIKMPSLATPVATDDWPYLYLSKRALSADYIIVISILLIISIISVVLLSPKKTGFEEAHFVFLGMGFLLLQTKSIVNCSLYFGTTWFVTMLIILGVLMMVLLANYVASTLKGFTYWYYAPLFLVLSILFLIPNDYILNFSFTGRLMWTLLVVPLPIFFAGLIFSSTFRVSKMASASFGANLVGATIGGFCEYLGMITGHQSLSLLVIAAYLMSLWCYYRYQHYSV